MLKRLFILLLSVCSGIPAASYVDHRGHNVDSLETVMAAWTARDLESAGEAELKQVAENLEGLMYGFNQTNSVKSEYYARLLLKLSTRFGWYHYEEVAAKGIGQHFWHREQYDSAAFYYTIAMAAVEKMAASSDPVDPLMYGRDAVDDALSQMYGTLGNLYSMMDSVGLAMEYYSKAGEIFKNHSWNESCADLYYNMGETMRYEGELDLAERYYQESLDYSMLTGDSLAVATASKGLGSVYLEMRKTAKAIRFLNKANLYFADHEDEELQFRMESLDYTSQVLALQKRRSRIMVLLFASIVLIACATYFVLRKLKRNPTESIKTASVASECGEIKMKPREKEILGLIAKGYTNADIASALSLSPETIKWYKKKLFAKFNVANSAELVKIASDRKLL